MKSYLEIGAAICALLFAVSRLFSEDAGGAIFSFFAAFFLFLHAVLQRPDEVVLTLLAGFRRFFQNGSRTARMLIIAIALGGTFLIVDYLYTIHFIWNWLDPTVKRMALPLVVAAVVFYGASIVSTVIHTTSDQVKDPSLRRYEFLYYLSATVLMVDFTLLMLGTPVEVLTAPKDDSGKPILTGIVQYFVWDPALFLAFEAIGLVALVWAIGFFLCILSRQSEWFFIVRPDLKAGPAVGVAAVRPRTKSRKIDEAEMGSEK